MKPPPFTYEDPEALDRALALLAEHGDDTVVLAGGQSLVPLLNLRLARPEWVLDPRRIASLHDWHLDSNGLRVGAMVRAATLEASPRVTSKMPGLHRALVQIGHPQIRARTTIGGSLCHADPAAELPAVLLALDGHVTLASTAGIREVAARDFFTGAFTTARRSDELLISAMFPIVPGRVTTVEVCRRAGDFAMAGAVVAIDQRRAARIALFGVGDRPERVADAEAAFVAGASTADVAAIVRAAVSPRSDVHGSAPYRRHLAGVVVTRALEELGA
ncbi:MAG: FAD binding domain-containing protein [Acidimicrobiales bacterium]